MAIIFLRTIIVLVAIIISMRIMGKRQLGDLELSELVVGILIANLASQPLQDIGIPLINGLVPVVTLLCFELLITGGIVKSVTFRRIICGRPSILIKDGRVIQTEMHKNRFTLDELSEELRRQGNYDFSKIKYAILETDGSLNAILFPAEMPVTASQMNIEVEDNGFPFIVINNGVLLPRNMEQAGFDNKWLKKTLKSNGVKEPSEVYLMTVNPGGQVYFCPMECEKR